MDGNFYFFPPEHVTRADDPVPDGPVPRFIYRSHDGIRSSGSADKKPEPPLTGERDTSASPVAVIHPAGVQNGYSRLVDELRQVEGCPRADLGQALGDAGFSAAGFSPRPAAGRLLSEVPGVVPGAARGDLSNVRGR